MNEQETLQYLYLTYTRKATPTPHIIIEKADPAISLIQVPDQIDGLPVTELAPYAMSGGAHEEICLPPGIQKIGRYAFYNTRKLHTLRFPSGIRDLGSGAFTGCHAVHYLEIYMEKDKPSCLKELLSELPEELQVDLHGEEEACLFFPEFFEEGVENTPARILMTEIHGSGLWYRNSFQNRNINYLEYDKCFDWALAQESFSFNLRLAVGRLRYPFQLGEKPKEKYLDFIRSNQYEAAAYFIEEKKEETLAWLLEQCPLDQPTLTKIQGKASRSGNPEINALLLKYQRTHFKPARQRRTL